MDLVNPKDDQDLAPRRSYRLQYTIKEACYIMNTSENTLRGWCQDYDVPIYKIGDKGSNFLLHKDLEVLILRGAVYQNKQFSDFYGSVKQHWDKINDSCEDS